MPPVDGLNLWSSDPPKSMLVRVLKLNQYRRFYSKINDSYLEAERLLFAGEVMEVETYGWLDASLTWQ